MNNEQFVLKEDGKIYHVTMPEKPQISAWEAMSPATSKQAEKKIESYKQALQLAIDNPIEVSNQEQVKTALQQLWGTPTFLTNKLYSLNCRVEKGDRPLNNCKACNALGVAHCAHPEECNQISIGPVAHVTFDSPSKDVTKSDLGCNNLPMNEGQKYVTSEFKKAEEFLIKELNMTPIQASTIYAPYILAMIKYKHSGEEVGDVSRSLEEGSSVVESIRRDINMFVPIISKHKVSNPFPLNYVYLNNGLRIEINMTLNVTPTDNES